MSSTKKKVLIVQRVLTPYRLELFNQLEDLYDVSVATSRGEDKGALKLADISKARKGINVKVLNSLRFGYKGESRSTSLYFYPSVIKYVLSADVLILEGTTNLLNNLYIIPLARILGKKVIWWDAGYSPAVRTRRRKLIDFIVCKLIFFTNMQFAYSSKAKHYMEKYMNARNCKLLLNTINTEYFETMDTRINSDTINHSIDKDEFRLLYVGALEERKKVLELIKMVERLNGNTDRKYHLTVVGGGVDYDRLKEYTQERDLSEINLTGPIYEKSELYDHYINADLFVLPGEGGLAIVQSLMFNLPVICVEADGTEFDYLSKERIFDNLKLMEQFIFSMKESNKSEVSEKKAKLYSSNWVSTFNESLNELLRG